MILPSLLEYSTEQLNKRLSLIIKNLEIFKKLSFQKELSLHLDFVLKYFAQERAVMMSLLPQTVLEILNKCLENKKLNLTLHFMGEVEDLYEQYKFLKLYKFNPNWSYKLFVPAKYFSIWEEEFQKDNVIVGIWYDLDIWDNQIGLFNNDIDYLLMTVKAGKSGQKASLEDKAKALFVAKENSNSRFILDGGWSVEDYKQFANIDLVSYVSFWKAFDSVEGLDSIDIAD